MVQHFTQDDLSKLEIAERVVLFDEQLIEQLKYNNLCLTKGKALIYIYIYIYIYIIYIYIY